MAVFLLTNFINFPNYKNYQFDARKFLWHNIFANDQFSCN